MISICIGSTASTISKEGFNVSNISAGLSLLDTKLGNAFLPSDHFCFKRRSSGSRIRIFRVRHVNMPNSVRYVGMLVCWSLFFSF